MQNGGVILVNTSMMVLGSNVSTTQTWNGGQGVLVLSAQQLAPLINLMFLAGDGSSTRQIQVNSGVILGGSQMKSFDLPAGSYQLHSALGSSIGIFAALMPTP
jgi:hypothetical protein